MSRGAANPNILLVNAGGFRCKSELIALSEDMTSG
jgi:hypothetical protein